MSNGTNLAGEETFLEGSTKFLKEVLFAALPNGCPNCFSVLLLAGKFDDESKAVQLLERVVLALIRLSPSFSLYKFSQDFCLPVVLSRGDSSSFKFSASDKSENDFDLLLLSSKTGNVTVLRFPMCGESVVVKNLGLDNSLSSVETLIAGSLVFMNRRNRACSAFRLQHLFLYSLSSNP